MAPPTLPEALARYYTALDAGAMDEAAAQFAPAAVYVRPALVPGPGGLRALVAVEGREAIRAWFAERGRRPTWHEITAAARDGDRVYVEGAVNGQGGPTQLFLATATLAPDGLIARYAAVTGAADGQLLRQLGLEL